MPNPLAIDAHAHICTEETMKLLNKETPKVASALKEIRKEHLRVDASPACRTGRCRSAASTSSSG